MKKRILSLMLALLMFATSLSIAFGSETQGEYLIPDEIADDSHEYMPIDAHSASNRVIYGTDDDDVIWVPNNLGHFVFGFGGNDIIHAAMGNNTIDPGTGNNRIYGGIGIDTYVIGRGYGRNTITAGNANSPSSLSARDRLVFSGDIRPDEVFFLRNGHNLEIIILNGGLPEGADRTEVFAAATNRVVLVDFFRLLQRRLVSITFPDGTVMTQTEIVNRGLRIYGTNDDDEIIVLDNLGHYIFGFGGNDIIHAAMGNNTIDPGPGNNVILGGIGTDTYVIGRGYGRNFIIAGNANNTSSLSARDMLIFRDDIRRDEVFLFRTDNNLEVIILDIDPDMARVITPRDSLDAATRAAIDNATNRTIFVDFFRLNQRQLVSITFPDGSVITRNEILTGNRVIYGMYGNDEIVVPNADGHLVYAFGGGNTIHAMQGNNTIDPGPGNNVIFGGTGTDTYVIGRDYGTNTITAGAANSTLQGTARDMLVFKGDIHRDEVQFVRIGNNLEISIINSPTRLIFVDYFLLAQRQLVRITLPDGSVITRAEIAALV